MSSKKKQPSAVKVAVIEKPKTSSNMAMIYLGPSIPNIVRHASVYRNGYPERLKKAMEETPAVKKLIVPITSAPDVIKELRKEQSAIANIYKLIATKYIK